MPMRPSLFRSALRLAGAASLAVALVGPAPSPAAADEPPSAKAARQVLDTAKSQSHPGIVYDLDPRTGLPSRISNLTPIVDPSVALSATANGNGPPSAKDVKHAAELFFQSDLSAAYQLGASQIRARSTPVKHDPDFPDRSVVEMEQVVGGVRVFGSTARVTLDSSLAVTQLTSSISPVGSPSVEPKISKSDATAAARAALAEILDRPTSGPKSFSFKPNPQKVAATTELVVFDPKLISGKATGDVRLAYLVSLGSYRLFIDAETSELLHYYRDVHSSMPRRVFDLKMGEDFTAAKRIIAETAGKKPIATPPASVQGDARFAFLNTGLVLDFYFSVFGRKAIDTHEAAASGQAASASARDANPATLDSYVRYSSLANAYWCPTPGDGCPKANVMVFGPAYANAIDVVGHEMTHGVIQHEANLIYSDEPGAVNESLADIFGTLIEFQVKGGDGNWLIGESLPGFSMDHPLRDMTNPHMKDASGKSMFDKTQPYDPATNGGQPDTYSELIGRDDAQCSGSDDDSGCAHFNSGIFNKFAHLISEGGTHYGRTVTGLGRDKLARIAYRALTVKLNDSSGLVAAAQAFVDACADLAQGNIAGIAPPDCDQVRTAADAVGLAPPPQS